MFSCECSRAIHNYVLVLDLRFCCLFVRVCLSLIGGGKAQNVLLIYQEVGRCAWMASAVSSTCRIICAHNCVSQLGSFMFEETIILFSEQPASVGVFLVVFTATNVEFTHKLLYVWVRPIQRKVFTHRNKMRSHPSSTGSRRVFTSHSDAHSVRPGVSWQVLAKLNYPRIVKIWRPNGSAGKRAT